MTVIRRYPDTIMVICDRNAGITWAGPNIPLDLDPREGKAEEEYVRADLHRGAVDENEKLRLQVSALENDGMELAAKLGEAEAEVERLRSDAWKWRHLAADAAADLNRREREITRLEATLDDTTRSLDDAEAEAERRHFAAIEDADEIRGFTDYPPEQ